MLEIPRLNGLIRANIERLIASGYRFLMPPAPRSFAVLEQGRRVAGRSEGRL